MNHARSAKLKGLAPVVTLALLAGCTSAPSQVFTVTGTVDDTTASIAVPAVAFPSGAMGLGSTIRVASVKVAEGDTVAAGQVVATLDDRILKAQLGVAKADQVAAKAQVDVLASAIETTHDKEREIADKRAEVEDGIAKGSRARTELSSNLAKARKAKHELTRQLAKVQKTLTTLTITRAKLRTQLDVVERALAALPPEAPPAIRDPLLQAQAKLTSALKKLDAGISRLTAGRRKLTAAIKQVNQGIPKLAGAIVTIDATLAKARKGLSQLERAARKVRDVRATLKDAKKLAEINADASGIPVRKARAQLDQATLKAPVAGVVTSAAHDGDLLAPGASAVTIRTSEPSQVSAWLSPAQAARSCSGDAVQLTGDWMPAGTSVPGSVTWLGTGYQYPPTDSTTDEIHLTRALQARISTQQAHLPAGVPVDISITGCHAAATTDTNG